MRNSSMIIGSMVVVIGCCVIAAAINLLQGNMPALAASMIGIGPSIVAISSQISIRFYDPQL